MGAFFGVIGGGLAKVGAWFLKNPAVLLSGVFCIAFVLIVVSKNAEISTLQRASDAKDTRIETMTTALGQARANVATMNATLQSQNAAVLALQQQGVAAGAKFDTLIAGMGAANATTAKKLAALDAAKPGENKCDSALALVRSSVK